LTAGNHRAAIDWLEKAAALNPRDFRARYRLARARQLSGEPGKAEHEYTLSAQIRERYNDAARQVGECAQAIRSGADPAVQPACRSLFDLNDPDKLTTVGMLYGQNGRYADAIEPLQMAARLDPDSFEVHHNLGVTYFRLKRYAEARGPLEKAVELRPDFFGSNALLGAVLFALKDDERAYRSLEHAHQLNPADTDTAELLAKTALVLAQRRHASEDYAGCARYLEVAASLRPSDETIRKRLEESRRLAKNTPGGGDNTGSAPRRERELQ
jgi:tetratricopeptide (TPR) repeat protein